MARRKREHPSLVVGDPLSLELRVCEWPGCREIAEHRAPRSRERLRDYRWFSLDHVRVYNSKWNYFEGMTDAEVEARLRDDTVWNRPTWRIGSNEKATGRPKPGNGPFGIDPAYFADDFGLFDDFAQASGVGTQPNGPRAGEAERAALAIFGLDLPVSADSLKSRYKELVKRHHPDANGGTKSAEEKFKEIRKAYETLRHFLVI